MKYHKVSQFLISGCIVLSGTVDAADLRFNGFASIVAGKTLSEGSSFLRGNPPSMVIGSEDAVFQSDSPTSGIYDNDVSFKPDTIFGLQISADLADGLSVTGQITGSGGEDFDANIAWAYISYELNQSWTMVAGRQRIPLFFYSDFLDVGYAYHWVRVPTETQIPMDTLDGIQLRHTGVVGDWDTRIQLYGGSSDNKTENLGDTLALDNAAGAVFYASNDWLQLRATHVVADFFLEETGDLFGQGDSDPVDSHFTGIAAHLSLGSGFIVGEYVTYTFEDAIQPIGWTTFDGAYISAGYRLGDFTPHITYSTENQEIEDSVFAAFGLTDGDQGSDSVTLGIRWDFHPQAAFKLEYQTRADESDENIKAYYGDSNEVDLVSAGFDVIF